MIRLLLAANWLESPAVTDIAAPFLLLVAIISVVTAALKKDRPGAIAGESVKLLVVLILGFALFCASLFLLGDPNAPFRG